jgi:hypothetical protein
MMYCLVVFVLFSGRSSWWWFDPDLGLMLILNLDFLDLGSGYKKVLFHLCGFDSTDVARKTLVRSRSMLAVVVFNHTFRTVSSVIGCAVGGLCPSFVRDMDFDLIDLARRALLAR